MRSQNSKDSIEVWHDPSDQVYTLVKAQYLEPQVILSLPLAYYQSIPYEN